MSWLARLKKADSSTRMEASNDPASVAQTPAPAPTPASSEPPAAGESLGSKGKPPKFLEWADGWLELDKAYQGHHWNCPVCIAAGKGYGLRCGAGAALYRAYEDASARQDKEGRP